MAQSKVELLIELKERVNAGLKRAKDAVSQSTADMKEKLSGLKGHFVSTFAEMRNQIPLFDKAIRFITNPIGATIAAIGALGAGFGRLKAYAAESIEAYKQESLAGVKLATVMRQRMNATAEEVESIKRLASEQQRLGVIGDEVQVAGAQQVSTFLTNKKSIDVLLPAMNNLLAQQKGLSATQEDAVNIGNLMGKVMQGQTAALTRVGITFTEAEENALKYGTEVERAAVLARVITNNVGEMNAAMAATPEGRIQQVENTMSDLQERAGGVFIALKAAWIPAQEAMATGWEKVISFFERNKGRIVAVVQTLASFVGNVISGVVSALGYIKSGFAFMYEWREVIIGVVAAFALLNAKLIATTVWTGILAVKNAALTAAQWLLNIAMAANPIGIIVVAIGALIGAIVAVCRRYEGWVTVWNAVKTTLVASFRQYISTWKFGFTELWYGVQIFWAKLKSFGEYAGQLFSNIGKAVKAALSGNFAEAKNILKSDIKTKASVEVEQLETARSANREAYKQEAIERAKEVANAWKSVKLTKKAKAENAAEDSAVAAGVGGDVVYDGTTAGGNEGISGTTDSVTGSAQQVRNITVNIDAFNKGGINAAGTDGLKGMDAEQISEWFNQQLMRAIRNLELSY